MKLTNLFSRNSLLLLIAMSLFLLLATGCSRKSKPTTKVTVAGEAVTRVEPDAAVLVLSVITQSPQAISAQQENARKSEAVSNAVKAIAHDGVEIRTSDYNLQPQYDYRDNRLPKIIGYTARNSVIITSEDLKNVGALIDAASGAGANSIDNVSFILRQTSPARGQAMAEATQQAMNKARSIAQALGGRVIRVIEESESGTIANDAGTHGETVAGMARQSTTPITAGQLSIRSTVQMIVEIET
jgi:uncharacterized protein YggE